MNQKEWIVQGKKQASWRNLSTGWRDRKPSKTEARDLFKGVKSEYSSVRLIKKQGRSKEVLWEDKDLLNQEIPIETVRD